MDAAAPSEPFEMIELADGGRMEVRPTTGEDAARISALYETLSEGDRHRRFFGAFRPHLDWCRQWADVAARGGFGVIAVVHRDGVPEEVAGEAGYALRDDGDGDLAVTVAPNWRGWLGPYLLDVLVRHAADVGIANLQADVLLENGPMLSVLSRRGPVALGHDSGIVRLSIGTSGPVPSWPPAEARPRVLVEVAGRRWSGEAAAESAGLATAMCAGPSVRRGDGCPVLHGGRCPLADEADAIVVLLDPDDEHSLELVRAHRQQSPGTPVLVRHHTPPSEGVDELGCIDVADDGGAVVAQILSLIGRSDADAAQR
jgi:hypothetical protein